MTAKKSKLLSAPWDSSNYLNTIPEAAAYLEVSIEEAESDDIPHSINRAIKTIARSNAGKSILSSEEINVLNKEAEPSIDVALKLIYGLGFKLQPPLSEL